MVTWRTSIQQLHIDTSKVSSTAHTGAQTSSQALQAKSGSAEGHIRISSSLCDQIFTAVALWWLDRAMRHLYHDYYQSFIWLCKCIVRLKEPTYARLDYMKRSKLLQEQSITNQILFYERKRKVQWMTYHFTSSLWPV